MQMLIKLNETSYTYVQKFERKRNLRPAPQALAPISLSVGEAEMIAVCGRTGSGKTTLLNLMKGMLKPTGGSIAIQGRDPWKERAPELFDDIGLVFQYPEHQLFAPTVFDDIAFGPRSRFGKGNTKAVQEAAKDAMQWVGLDPKRYADRSPFELSGGEKRRAALAGVLALKPRLLLLDEPTAGLDLDAREALFTLLHDLRKQTKMTVLWVTHQPSEALRHADRLLWLDGGELIREGSPSEVLEDDTFMLKMGTAIPESLSVRRRLLAAGFKGLDRPWETAGLAVAILKQLNGRQLQQEDA